MVLIPPSNIASILDGPADACPDRAALIMADGTVCTYGHLRDETQHWAATLSRRGLDVGDRVALADWGGVRSTAVTLGAARLGAATAQMNPLLTAAELAQLVAAADCVPVGISDDEPDVVAALVKALGSAGSVLVEPDRPDPNGPAFSPGMASGGDEDALVLFTSGTTGLPKPIPVTHDAVAARIAAYRPPFDAARPAGVTLMCVPSFHVGGLLGLLLSLASGDTTVVQPRFDAGEWLALVSRHRVASAFVVPTMLARILDHPDLAGTDLGSLRVISYGAAAAPIALVRRAMEQWPEVAFANVFGQTETLGAYTTLTPDDHRNPERIGSVGRPLPGVEVRVVDPITGADVERGDEGELWVRSPQNVREGWLETGDLGRLDADGYLFPTGRRSDLINRGGEKFGPHEVAEALRSHPAVADVAVVGVPDTEMGERVGVAVVTRRGAPAPTLDDLRTWCTDRVAPFKRPEVAAFVDALPVNELGKLPRRAVVELIEAQA
jgi:acyl-CoA synthetase (AMP-forming)/AMP-acid ligase II